MKGLVACGEIGPPDVPNKSSAKRSVNNVDLESTLGDVGEVGDSVWIERWEIEVAEDRFSSSDVGKVAVGVDAGDIQSDGERPWIGCLPGYEIPGLYWIDGWFTRPLLVEGS